MTDRVYALTVALNEPIRDDDAQRIIETIKMIRGVANVDAHVADPETYFAIEKVRNEIGKKLLAVIYPEHGER